MFFNINILTKTRNGIRSIPDLARCSQTLLVWMILEILIQGTQTVVLQKCFRCK